MLSIIQVVQQGLEIKENVKRMEHGFSHAWNKMIDKILSWYDAFIVNIPNIAVAIIVFSLSILLSRSISKLCMRLFRNSSMQDSEKKIISRIIATVFIILGLMLALLVLNLSNVMKTILAGAGVMGLAVGLALQGTLSNTFSGIVLSVVKQIRIGDWIESNSYEGEIVDIDFRMTSLKTVDNNIVLIPNKLVLENAIKNYSLTDTKRIILKCGVGYESDLELVRKITIEVVEKNVEKLMRDLEVLFVYREFGDSSINYELRFWVNTDSGLEALKIKSDIIIAIKKAYDANGINIPFPIRTLDIPTNTLEKLTTKNS